MDSNTCKHPVAPRSYEQISGDTAVWDCANGCGMIREREVTIGGVLYAFKAVA